LRSVGVRAVPLLIMLVVVLLVLVAWVLLLPLWLYLRFRQGKARRRLVPWMVRVNAWAALLSTTVFVMGMAITGHWWPGALTHALAGVGAGLCTGLLGVVLGRVEHTPTASYHTPSAWVSGALALLVVLRLAAGGVDAWRRLGGHDALRWLPAFDHTTLFALGGLLLGHGLATAWGLRWRLPRRR
jgi:hypothetical protein